MGCEKVEFFQRESAEFFSEREETEMFLSEAVLNFFRLRVWLNFFGEVCGISSCDSCVIFFSSGLDWLHFWLLVVYGEV